MERWNNSTTENLCRAILKLKDVREAKRFFRDLLTEEEIIEFGKRWQAAQMLQQRIPYTQIVTATGLSSTTVARVAKWLKSGLGGYRLVLGRLGHHGNPSFEKGLS